jgi:hypothetical protein
MPYYFLRGGIQHHTLPKKGRLVNENERFDQMVIQDR